MTYLTRNRPAWTIANTMWLAYRPAFLAVLSAIFLCGLGFRIVGPSLHDADARSALGYLPMGLLLFATFVLCGFTETDRRGRFTGFPSRLFTLPVPTQTLIATPILFGIVAVGLIYMLWAKLVLPALGRTLPLAWPALYLTTGMICYQAIVWCLARFRVMRILALGVGGTFFAIGWIAFRNDFERELISWLIPADVPIRPVFCVMLAGLSVAAYGAAYVGVESQRRGGSVEWQGWRKWVELMTDALPRRRQRLNSPNRSQFWFEWRRHGVLLPLSIAGVLLIIIAPAPFLGTISAESTFATLGWILILPLLLAFALGQGFGKSDLWSRESGISLFLSTRPLGNTEWIGAKLRAAALAALISWVIVLIVTPWWVCMWGNWQSVTALWPAAEAYYSPRIRYALLPLTLASLVILTWRCLISSLFIGLSGKSWMLAAAACNVFVVILGAPFIAIAWSNHPTAYRHLLRIPFWFPWLLAGVFAAKVVVTLAMMEYAEHRGWVTRRSVRRYVMAWFATTGCLALTAWLLIPVQGWAKWCSALLSLFAVPLLRVAYAPIALDQNRRQ